MKVLFIGGTGIISSACSELAIEKGFDLWLLNRGQSFRPIPEGAKIIKANIREIDKVRSLLSGHRFDVVVDWIAYTPDHVDNDIKLFKDQTSQYIFISSASAYQTPPTSLPVTESTILSNPFWQYSRDKIACEDRLINAYRNEGFPVTIVRPSHTYDKATIPLRGGYTAIERMRRGKKVIIHGDGTSLWTLTHHKDFAKGFVGLLGNYKAIGEAYHITSDEVLNWNQICEILAEAAGVTPNIIHIPSDIIARFEPEWGASLLGDKSQSMIFDNTKIKRTVPEFCATISFSQGAREIIEWFYKDKKRQVSDRQLDQTKDEIIKKFESIFYIRNQSMM